MWRIVVVLLSVVAAQGAEGAIITFNVAGVVTGISEDAPILGDAVRVGDVWSASYTFDPLAPDSLPGDPRRGFYSLPRTSVVLNVGSITVGGAVPPGSAYIEVDDAYYPGLDRYAFQILRTFTWGDLGIGGFGIVLDDSTGTVFQGDALRVTPPPLDRFQQCAFETGGGKSGTYTFFDIRGTVTTFTPEPSAFLLAAGGALLAARRRRRVATPLAVMPLLLVLTTQLAAAPVCQPGEYPSSAASQVGSEPGQGSTPLSPPGSETVDIVFVLDGSGSIFPSSWVLEKWGVANCLDASNPVIPANGRVAVAVVEFESSYARNGCQDALLGAEKSILTSVPVRGTEQTADDVRVCRAW
jgi:hypothetical protein